MIYPLVVTAVALLFSGTLIRIFLVRHRPYHLAWAASMTLGAIAGGSFWLFLESGRSPWLFKVYYVSGGLLMAAYLGVGSVYLLLSKKVGHAVCICVTALGLVGSMLTATLSLDNAALQKVNVEAGTGLVHGPVVALIAVLNTFGAASVLGGAIFSALRVQRSGNSTRLIRANVTIAVGTILASVAGFAARSFGGGQWFWIVLAIGMVVLFAGFMLATSAGKTGQFVGIAETNVVQDKGIWSRIFFVLQRP